MLTHVHRITARVQKWIDSIRANDGVTIYNLTTWQPTCAQSFAQAIVQTVTCFTFFSRIRRGSATRSSSTQCVCWLTCRSGVRLIFLALAAPAPAPAPQIHHHHVLGQRRRAHRHLHGRRRRRAVLGCGSSGRAVPGPGNSRERVGAVPTSHGAVPRRACVPGTTPTAWRGKEQARVVRHRFFFLGWGSESCVYI